MKIRIDRNQRKSRADYSLWVLMILIVILLWRSGVFAPDQWQTFLDKCYDNFVRQNRYLWLIEGLRNTVLMTLMASALGIVIGLVLSLINVLYRAGARIRALRVIANVYITVIRGTPVMIQIFILYFVVFQNYPGVSKLLAAGIAFGINSGAYVAEIFRAGIESIDIGQMEAGRALGLSYAKTMRMIILPQAIKNILPALFNELITLLKETSVAGYIALNDLTRAGLNIKDATYDAATPLLAVAFIYLLIVMILTWLMHKLERFLARGDRKAAKSR